ncbi:MAG: ribonuclease P protein subunit [archaeon]|jgi:RNase P/RNase MRP subunit p29
MLNVKYSDLIGKEVLIKNSTDKTKIGAKGLAIYQTKELLKLRNKEKIIIIKNNEIINLEITSK